jgi:hypothetical protein
VEGEIVRLRFLALGIEAAATCNFDFLRITGENFDERFCGNEIDSEVVSARGPINVQFFADGTVQDEGFQLYFFIEDETEGSGEGPIPDPGNFYLIFITNYYQI